MFNVNNCIIHTVYPLHVMTMHVLVKNNIG